MNVLVRNLLLTRSNIDPNAARQDELEALQMMTELLWVLQYVCDAIWQIKQFVASALG